MLGMFSNEVVSAVELRAEASGLWMQFEPNSHAQLHGLENGDFLATFAGTETNPISLRLRFEHDDSGRVSGSI